MGKRTAVALAAALVLLGGCRATPTPDAALSPPSATAIAITGSPVYGTSSDDETLATTTGALSISAFEPTSTGPEPIDTPVISAAELLELLPVKGRAPKTGYERSLFGEAWIDDVTVNGGRNGCRTREDILRRDLTAVVLKPGTRGCAVLNGVLDDPYTGISINFVRGQDTSALVQIDHVVALSDSWQKGAQQLSQTQRENFANDPLNLLAVDGKANQSKGAGDAATWLPSNKAIRCDYVARQIAVKARYSLWITEAEKIAMEGILIQCPGEKLPSDADVAVPELTG